MTIINDADVAGKTRPNDAAGGASVQQKIHSLPSLVVGAIDVRIPSDPVQAHHWCRISGDAFQSGVVDWMALD